MSNGRTGQVPRPPNSTPTPALDLTGRTKRYDNGFLALDAFDLEVPTARRVIGLAEQDVTLDRFLDLERRCSTTAATTA